MTMQQPTQLILAESDPRVFLEMGRQPLGGPSGEAVAEILGIGRHGFAKLLALAVEVSSLAEIAVFPGFRVVGLEGMLSKGRTLDHAVGLQNDTIDGIIERQAGIKTGIQCAVWVESPQIRASCAVQATESPTYQDCPIRLNGQR